jgi:hypothetical protein
MSDNWKGTEAQLFAEFVEHRAAIMLFRRWWRPGYSIALVYDSADECTVRIRKIRTQGTSVWEAEGVGTTLVDAFQKAAAQAAFRD